MSSLNVIEIWLNGIITWQDEITMQSNGIILGLNEKILWSIGKNLIWSIKL